MEICAKMVNDQDVAVVIVPFPTKGHLPPLFYLAIRHIPVHYVSSPSEVNDAATTYLHFLGDCPTQSPQEQEEYSSDSDSSSEADPIAVYCERVSSLVNKFISENRARRVVVIFDALMAPVVESVISLPNVKSYVFECMSALNLFASYWVADGKMEDWGDWIPAEGVKMMKQLIPESEGFGYLINRAGRFLCGTIGTILNTNSIAEDLCTGVLSEIIKAFGQNGLWVFGPFNPVFEYEIPSSDSKCLEWLNIQPKNSVLFVSIGTPSDQKQMDMIASGLELSEQRFLWLLRGGDSEVPEGFEERVRERGIVVREWVPQLEILKHFATGGFMTNCGWSSCMESISMGVPMAVWTMKSDDPGNAVLITKVLKIGVEVRDWGRKDKKVHWFTVEEAVRTLITDPEERNEMRERAEELADTMKQSMTEGGATQVEMESFIAHFTIDD